MASKTLPRPIYAVAGASDAVAEQLRKLASRAPAVQQQLQSRVAVLPAELRQLGRELPRDLQSLAADLPSYAAGLQSRARELDPAKVTDVVRKNVQTAQVRARDVYADLIARGQKVVDREDGVTTTPAVDATVVAPTPIGTAPTATGTQTAVKTAARTTARKTATRSATRPGTEQS